MSKEQLKYVYWGLGALAAVFGVYFLYKTFLKAKESAATAADALADKKLNTDLAKMYSVDEFSVETARKTAKDIAVELETMKDMSAWDRATHVQLDSDTMEIMKRPKTEKELRLVAHFYRNQFTANNVLYNDLKAVLSSKDLRNIPFIESISK